MAAAQLVSIALCTYNGERFLPQQLDSILKQDYENTEVVIIDDGSRDGTRQLLEFYAGQDRRIRLFFNEENLGYTKNFEKAISLCTGKYIALADQDDVWETTKLSRLVPQVGDHMLIFHNSAFIDYNGDNIGGRTVAGNTRIYDGESCLPFLFSNCVHGHAALFHSKLKAFLFPFDKRFSHDWWLAYVSFNVGKVKYIDEVLVNYRQHAGSITDTLKLRADGPANSKPVKGIDRILPDLELIKHCADFSYNRDPALMKEAWQVFSDMAKGRSRLRNFFFVLKYYDLLFYMRFKPKSLLSKINMVRKICFE